jgi:hypothetical protein
VRRGKSGIHNYPEAPTLTRTGSACIKRIILHYTMTMRKRLEISLLYYLLLMLILMVGLSLSQALLIGTYYEYSSTSSILRRGSAAASRSTTSFVILSASSSSANTLDYLETVREGMAEMGFDVEEWESCGILLAEKTGLSLEESQDVLAKAWSWKSWAVTTSKIARKYIKPKEPSVSIVEGALSWLEGEPLNLSTQQEFTRAVRSDPVAYLVDPATSYQKALQAAPPEYKDVNAFHALLADKPEALKNYANCKEDGCNSECGNCWVSFKLKGDYI